MTTGTEREPLRVGDMVEIDWRDIASAKKLAQSGGMAYGEVKVVVPHGMAIKSMVPRGWSCNVSPKSWAGHDTYLVAVQGGMKRLYWVKRERMRKIP